MKKDGINRTNKMNDAESENHVQRGLERMGFQVRQARVSWRGDATSSCESCKSSPHSLVDEGDNRTFAGERKSTREVSDVILGRRTRRLREGLKLNELHRAVEEAGSSEDDLVSLFDLQSDSWDSCASDVNFWRVFLTDSSRWVKELRLEKSAGILRIKK